MLIISELLAGEGVYSDTQYVTDHLVLRLMNKSLLWFDRHGISYQILERDKGTF